MNHQRLKTKTVESDSRAGCDLRLGASYQEYHLPDDRAIAKQIFQNTQDVFESEVIRWPARGSKESILEFMEKVKELMRKARRVEAGGGENKAQIWSWEGGKDEKSCYNVQCVLRPIVGILADFDPSTVGEITFDEWLKYLPDRGKHCTELGSKTYGQIVSQFAPLTPAEVCSWACLLSGTPTDRLKSYIASDPGTVWEKFTAAAGRTPPSEDDVFTPAADEFLED